MWIKQETLLIYNSNNNFKNNNKIISFDLDDTIIKTKSNKKLPEGVSLKAKPSGKLDFPEGVSLKAKPSGKLGFPIDKNDQEFKYNSNKKLLEEYNKGDTNIVIFTNQSSITKNGYNKEIEDDIRNKIEDIIEKINIPIDVFISISNDKYRKPNNLMWDKMIEMRNKQFDLKKCLYVGDASGREKNKYHPKDFSDTDYKFALNIGIQFKTPEEYFNIDTTKEELLVNYYNFNMLDKIDNQKIELLKSKEIIIFVGYPGSGKSYFYKKYLNSYEHINQDTLKTKLKCFKLCMDYMKQNKNIVIDNTNPSKEIRQKYIYMAQLNNYKCRCFYFNTDLLLSKHMNYYRSIKTNQERVPDIAYNIFKSKFEYPTLDEGFKEIKVINPIIEFENEKDKKDFFKYLF